jgi:hypothetical protein
VATEVHDRADDGHIIAVGPKAGDEALVDFHLLHRQALEVGQGGEAGPEVIDGQAHP